MIIKRRGREGEVHGRAQCDRGFTRQRRHAEQAATRGRMRLAIGMIGRPAAVIMVMGRIVAVHRTVSVHMCGTTVIMAASHAVQLRQAVYGGRTIDKGEGCHRCQNACSIHGHQRNRGPDAESSGEA